MYTTHTSVLYYCSLCNNLNKIDFDLFKNEIIQFENNLSLSM